MNDILVPMNMHNVFRECAHDKKDEPQNAQAEVHPFVKPLIAELSIRRPTWTFVTNRSQYFSGAPYHFTGFEVREDDETLGWINTSTNWRSGARLYEFDCRLMRHLRQRGSCNQTKDLKKAVKAIVAHFVPMSHRELIGNAQSATRNAMHRAVSARDHNFKVKETAIRPYTMKFLTARWAEVLESIPDLAIQARVADLPEAYSLKSAADELMNVFGNQGTFVKLQGSKYIVHRVASDKIYIYDGRTLPDDLREGLGALKLVTTGNVIGGVGVRGDDNSFYLMAPEKPDE